MKKLSRSDLFSLEAYSDERLDFRTRVLAHKVNRRVEIGPHATLYFEDALTMQYQVCLLYTSPSPRDGLLSRMPSSA